MFCRKCGNQLADGEKFCPNCGAVIDAGAQNSQSTAQSEPMSGTLITGGRRPVYRNIAVCILLSLVTCGIYGWYWLVVMADELNELSNNGDNMSGVTVMLLSIITCGIFSFVWLYKAGGQINSAKAARGLDSDTNLGLMYLLLAIFGFSIISYSLIQNELNIFSGH